MTDSPDYIELLINDLLGPGIAGGTNHDVYEPRPNTAAPDGGGGGWPPPPFSSTPCCVYFYYVRFDRDGALRVDHYFYPNGPLDHPEQWQPIDGSDLPAIIAKLAQNGRPSTTVKNPPKDPAHNFENIDWKHISYIAIFVDEANWKLHKRTHGQGAIVFNPAKGSTPNASFFDARDILVSMPLASGGSDERTAVYFVNYMTVESAGGGIVCDHGSSKYVFDVYFDVAFAEPAANPAVIIFDPTGTNQGPPEKP